MAPLLRIGKYLKPQGWKRLSPFNLRRSKFGPNKAEENPNPCDRDLRLRPDGATVMESDATAKRSDSVVEDDDLVPSQSILARRDLVCTETRS